MLLPLCLATTFLKAYLFYPKQALAGYPMLSYVLRSFNFDSLLEIPEENYISFTVFVEISIVDVSLRHRIVI